MADVMKAANCPSRAEYCGALIERPVDHTGGFGAFLGMAHDWSDPEATKRSYALLASEVCTAFQGSADWPKRAPDWACACSGDLIERQMLAAQRARERHERAVAEREPGRASTSDEDRETTE
jgi:limonene 1,2-monooxygenase